MVYSLKHLYQQSLSSVLAIALLVAPQALANDSETVGTANTTSAQAFTIEVFNSRHHAEHLQLNYPQSVRLEQVLTDTVANLALLPTAQQNINKSIYWTGAGLYKKFPHPNKVNVINQLGKVSELVDTDEKIGFEQLATQLNQFDIGERIFTPLDYDVIRIDKASNPLISESLSVVLPSRPDSVWVLGAVHTNGQQSWLPRTNASDYLKHVGRAAYGNNSVATVIQPDGVIEQHPTAYWNQNHKDIAPGAIVYLGFDNLPSGYTHLNDEIINLLRNKAL
ncbi:capsule biosynthesis GfcC family protein [Photobacterium sp. ZSDE20]|uniref:Capsule biosynthesis GfcC family protein n=1 Tax=Photobacterium pectinilyticum TaxID=2906793 RepID=A0ABT1N5M5_9GAMM|nr:capsule biosynthesis GfcC family protein [Photobacterium sp. ZSDE20]MCQ1060016.1 capsule biosynthesis GfcC family protein [Photobacterium sp. ZSDE20]MDD1826961.1 capsule biosynthesis GfcC family protein [Photobacterium sp. ZSDE20]